MIWLSDLTGAHEKQVGKNILEMDTYQKQVGKHQKGFVVPSNIYDTYLDRNKIVDVICDVVDDLEPEMASRTIAAHFNKSTYSSEEIQYLMDHYHQLKKPVTVWAQLINKASGEPLNQGQTHHVSGIQSFDVLSDAIVNTWSTIWNRHQVSLVSSTKVSAKDYGVVVLVKEDQDTHTVITPDHIPSLKTQLEATLEKRKDTDKVSIFKRFIKLFKKPTT